MFQVHGRLFIFKLPHGLLTYFNFNKKKKRILCKFSFPISHGQSRCSPTIGRHKKLYPWKVENTTHPRALSMNIIYVCILIFPGSDDGLWDKLQNLQLMLITKIMYRIACAYKTILKKWHDTYRRVEDLALWLASFEDPIELLEWSNLQKAKVFTTAKLENLVSKHSTKQKCLKGELTRTTVPFVAIHVGGLRKSLMAGNKTCCIDHSRWAQAVSASDRSSCEISVSIVTSLPEKNGAITN